MKRDTRQAILDAARELFNERGYNAVSLRDIADAVGISKGNLTYYFAKKEDLVEALVLECGPMDAVCAVPTTLRSLDEAFVDMQQAVQQNAYFFSHYTQLSQISPDIHRRQIERYRVVRGMFEGALESLRERGLLCEELYAGEYGTVVDTLYLSIIYWASFAEIKRSAGDQGTDYRHHAWGVVYPLLTPNGQASLREVIEL